MKTITEALNESDYVKRMCWKNCYVSAINISSIPSEKCIFLYIVDTRFLGYKKRWSPQYYSIIAKDWTDATEDHINFMKRVKNENH